MSRGRISRTGGIIKGVAGIRAAYATGRGRCRVTARTEIEEGKDGRFRIIVTEIPYQVNKSRLLEQIAECVKDKRIEGISYLEDESGRNGMRIRIDLKRDANPQVVLNQLLNYTQLSDTCSFNMLALVDGQPKTLGLKEILHQYILFQEEIVVRRTRFDLKKAEERAHLLEGLRIAVDNIDEIIRIIRSSYDDARTRLMERLAPSTVQAQAILEMQHCAGSRGLSARKSKPNTRSSPSASPGFAGCWLTRRWCRTLSSGVACHQGEIRRRAPHLH